jgi:hypothetical protein|tara:strand:+ start:281 stop:454 length:174 start_codon:yes stop_codon:yes gene_type:complete
MPRYDESTGGAAFLHNTRGEPGDTGRQNQPPLAGEEPKVDEPKKSKKQSKKSNVKSE